MSLLVLDVETTTKNKGNAFTASNKLVNVGWSFNDEPVSIRYSDADDFNSSIQSILDQSHLLVGFNIKFDLHWLRRYGFKFSHLRIWDCQIAEQIMEMGFLLGLGGVLTYKNAGVAEAVVDIPLEFLVLETDAPYLPPVPYRGKRNESAFMIEVAKKLAEIKNIPLHEIAETVS